VGQKFACKLIVQLALEINGPKSTINGTQSISQVECNWNFC